MKNSEILSKRWGCPRERIDRAVIKILLRQVDGMINSDGLIKYDFTITEGQIEQELNACGVSTKTPLKLIKAMQ